MYGYKLTYELMFVYNKFVLIKVAAIRISTAILINNCKTLLSLCVS